LLVIKLNQSILVYIVSNKNVDIEISAHDAL